MAEANIVEESIDRVQEAFRNVEDEIEKFQKRFAKRRKRVEKDARQRIKKLRADFSRNSLVKRAESFQKDATKQVEQGIESMLASLQIASQSDVKKLDRKLGQISRKLNALEKAQSEAKKVRVAESA
jgi:hypothetical protein